ncbi:MAG: hypothetical protein P1V51_03910 [Deltaproteobacteria bacterium]|nr:hypothetical protein [Deltaproteobacteria bacterium]
MRTDHEPGELKRGLLREGAAHLGHGLLYGFGYLRSRHRPLRRKELHTLVFVHGLGGNRAGFFPLQGYLAWHGHDRQLAYNYRSSGASLEGLGLELKRLLDAQVRGGRITLVAHSMGGLVSRVYLQLLGGHRRVERLVTLGTPHLGSHATAYLPTPLVSQLRPGGPFLEHLNALPPPGGVEVLSIAAEKDLMVLPAENALCPFGERRMIPGRGHLDLLFSREVFREIRDFVTFRSAD